MHIQSVLLGLLALPTALAADCYWEDGNPGASKAQLNEAARKVCAEQNRSYHLGIGNKRYIDVSWSGNGLRYCFVSLLQALCFPHSGETLVDSMANVTAGLLLVSNTTTIGCF